MYEPIITITGNLTGDPELRFTQSGAAVANFTVASTPKTKNRQTDQYEDGEALFVRCSVWKDYAEHVAESLQKGMRVIVTGRLSSQSYESQSGEKRSSLVLDVDEVGPSLRFATAQVTKAQGGQSRSQQPRQQNYGGNNNDPWSNTDPSNPPF